MLEDLHISELQHRIAAFEDQLAYKELFRRFQPALKRLAFSICHVREEAEEAVSDVFIRIWVRRKSLDQIHNLRLYLYIATRNFSLNYLRAHKQAELIEPEKMHMEIESFAANPHQQLISRELQQQVLQAINALPPQCRVVFKLVKEDGLRQREVAELLHLQPKTVENQISIAIKKIAQTIKADLNRKKGTNATRKGEN